MAPNATRYVNDRELVVGRTMPPCEKLTMGPESNPWSSGALEGTRTPNLLIRSQMLYPLSYERNGASLRGHPAPPTSAMRQPTGHQLAVHHGRQLPDRCQVMTAIRALITGSNNWLRSVTP